MDEDIHIILDPIGRVDRVGELADEVEGHIEDAMHEMDLSLEDVLHRLQLELKSRAR